MKVSLRTLKAKLDCARSLSRCFQLLMIALVFFHTINISIAFAGQRQERRRTTDARLSFRLSSTDDAFLEDLSHRSFQFFWEQTNPNTGLTLDRARADNSPYPITSSNYNIASIASTGFGLTAVCIAAGHQWITRDEARNRVLTTLDFFANRTENVHGWFFHFVDATTGERRWRSEVSSIDTALLLAGVLTARQYFSEDAEVARLADSIYRRVFKAVKVGNKNGAYESQFANAES